MKNKYQNKYQLVKYFPQWRGIYFIRQFQKSDMRYVYDWYLGLGFWELRKWHALTENDICDECGIYMKDDQSNLCSGCATYKEHQF